VRVSGQVIRGRLRTFADVAQALLPLDALAAAGISSVNSGPFHFPLSSESATADFAAAHPPGANSFAGWPAGRPVREHDKTLSVN